MVALTFILEGLHPQNTHFGSGGQVNIKKRYTLKMAPELDNIPMIVRIVVYVTASCEY